MTWDVVRIVISVVWKSRNELSHLGFDTVKYVGVSQAAAQKTHFDVILENNESWKSGLWLVIAKGPQLCRTIPEVYS